MRLYFSRAEQIAVAVFLCAILVGVALVGWNHFRTAQHTRATRAPMFQPGSVPRAAVETTPNLISTDLVVHVTGAVKQPGLYTLPAGARFNDAIRKAGGAKADGYPDALNLAAHLEDGLRIYVPTKAEWQQMTAEDSPTLVTPAPREAGTAATSANRAQPYPALVTNSAAASRPAAATTKTTAPKDAPVAVVHPTGPKPLPTALVALNSATKAQLMTLPGIGAATADAILAYRTEHGPFNDLAELQNVPRIGAKTLEKLRPYVTL